MKNIIVLFILTSVFFFLGNNIISLTNPDEVFYVQTAKEMAQHGTWSTPYLFGQPQFEKPVLTYDFLRLAAIGNGFTPFAMRFFPALFAALGVFAIYGFGCVGFSQRRKGMLAALVLMSSFLYLGMGRTVFTDMIFSVFIAISLVVFYWGYARPSYRRAAFILFYVFAGLAVLTKGPLGFLIPFAVVVFFLAMKGELAVVMRRSFLAGFILFLFLAVPWYAVMIKTYGRDFIQEFFINDHIRRILEAEHRGNDKWYFYPLVMIGGMFPWAIFVVSSFVMYVRAAIAKNLSSPRFFLLLWIVAVFLAFQFAHSKLVSYILPLFPALALMIGDFIDEELNRNARTIRVHLFFSCLMPILIPTALLVAAVKYAIYLPPRVELIGFLFLSIVISGAMAVLILRRKFIGGICLLAGQALLVLALIFLSAGRIEDYASSRGIAEFLRTQPMVQGRILCSKMFLRGVHAFTDQDVALMSVGGSPLFSPHAVPVFDTEEKVVSFLKAQPVTYCVLDSGCWKGLQRILGSMGRRGELLKVIGNQFVIRVSG